MPRFGAISIKLAGQNEAKGMTHLTVHSQSVA